MSQRTSHRIFVRACVVRELLSSAMLRASRIGDLETIIRLRTRSFEAMERSGRMTRFGIRRYSMAGMMATSAAPTRNSSAHCDGTVKVRSYLPCKGPCVKPRTSGAVLRYCTTEMRSLLTKGSRGKVIIAEANFVRIARLWCKRFVPFGGFEDDETDALRGCVAGGCVGAVRARRSGAGWRNCGQNEGRAEARRLFQFVLGHQGREIVARNRQME